MKISLSYIIDKLFVFFLALNILFLDDLFLNFPLRYLILFIIVILSLFGQQKFSKNTVNFMAIAGCCFTYLLLYALIRENSIENISKPLNSYFFLLGVLPLNYLVQYYPIQRYLNCIYILIGLVILCFILINIYFLIDTSAIYRLSMKYRFIQVSFWGNFFPRVVINNFVLILPLYFYCFIKSNNTTKKILLTFFVIALIIMSSTLGLFFGLFAGLFVLFINHYGLVRLFYVIPIICLFLILNPTVETGSIINESKVGSMDIKSSQINNYSKDMNGIDWLLGRGIGAEFQSFDSRGTKDTMLEISIIQAFQSGGIFGMFIILLIYSYHIVKYLRIMIFVRKLNFSELNLFLAQSSIFMTSLTNPYIWSGGVGLLFVLFFLVLNSKQVNNSFT